MHDDFRATALPIAAAIALSMLGLGMMVPAMPQLADGIGSAGVAAGALMGAYGFSRLLFNTPSGILVDRIGIARSAVFGLVVLAANSIFGYLAIGLAPLLIAMAVQGAASSVFSTAAMTALMLKAGPKARGRALAWFQTALLLGFAVGPMIGGVVVDRFGPHSPFLLQAPIALLALFAVRAMPRSAPVARNAAVESAGLASLLGPALIVGGLGGFASFFSRFGVAWNVVPVAATHEFNLSTSELGWIIGVGTVANILVMPVLGKLVDGWGAKPTFIAASLLNLAGLLALYFAPSLEMLWVSTAIVMLATGIMLPAAGALALTNAKPQFMGRMTGIFRTVGESGMAFGPIVVPAVTAAGGLPVLAGLLVCAAVTAIALAAAALLASRRPDHRGTR
jgi:MFS family permease